MIHILLLVLKIIGIILLVILLAAIAVIMAVLFVPVRYNLTAEYYDNKPDVKFNVSWLLHFFRINGLYNKNDGFLMKVKILFFTLYPKNKKTDADDNAVKKSHEKKTEKKEQKEHKRHEKNVFDDLPDKDELQDKQEGPCQQEVSVDELKKPENVSQKMIEKKESHSETCKKTGIRQKISGASDKIKNIAVLQRQEDGKWVEVSRYIYDAKKEDFPTEDLSGMSNDFTVKNQKTGYYYRVVGVHYVESNGKGQSFMTKTDGIKITEYGD